MVVIMNVMVVMMVVMARYHGRRRRGCKRTRNDVRDRTVVVIAIITAIMLVIKAILIVLTAIVVVITAIPFPVGLSSHYRYPVFLLRMYSLYFYSRYSVQQVFSTIRLQYHRSPTCFIIHKLVSWFCSRPP